MKKILGYTCAVVMLLTILPMSLMAGEVCDRETVVSSIMDHEEARTDFFAVLHEIFMDHTDRCFGNLCHQAFDQYELATNELRVPFLDAAEEYVFSDHSNDYMHNKVLPSLVFTSTKISLGEAIGEEGSHQTFLHMMVFVDLNEVQLQVPETVALDQCIVPVRSNLVFTLQPQNPTDQGQKRCFATGLCQSNDIVKDAPLDQYLLVIDTNTHQVVDFLGPDS